MSVGQNISTFFFNDTATTEIYTLSLHDALPISPSRADAPVRPDRPPWIRGWEDRKSTRLNSSHQIISYAVFCLKEKTKHAGLSAVRSTAALLLHAPSAPTQGRNIHNHYDSRPSC